MSPHGIQGRPPLIDTRLWGPGETPPQTAVNRMGQSVPVNPAQAIAPIPDTSYHALGLEDEADKALEASTSGLRRVVEKTVDKLGRTRSLGSRSLSKRIFSLGRSKGKEPAPSGAIQIHFCLHRFILTDGGRGRRDIDLASAYTW
jgi:hypothetical protein